ncbi:ribokinase [Porticoccus sp. W117]|uniref:ribokinase n=1 Tax=Porticoccus sp. W117 TaxID=3054777 RepID=UPI00259A583E|nr:ribokinase [Porticoccus sp. W117]MDM3872615.1 ribokinase [Porticoccus sp. W117]
MGNRNMHLNQNKKVVVVGSINCDIAAYVDEFPTPAQTVLARRSNITLGGKGLNQAMASLRAGSDISLIGCIGKDNFGSMALEFLTENDIKTEHIKVIQGTETGVANILVSSRGQNMIAVCPGANANLTPKDVLTAEEQIIGSEVLLTQMEVPVESVKSALTVAAENQIKSIFNPAPALEVAKELFSIAYLITPNEVEVESFTGILPQCYESASEAAIALRQLGAQSIIITMGDKGCFVSENGRNEMIPAYSVEPLDSTGAGDVFNGVLASCLAKSEDLFSAARTASAAAAISVTRHSAQGASPTEAEIKDFIGHHHNRIAI